MNQIRHFTYDLMFGAKHHAINTPNLLARFFEKQDPNQRILDVGVGTGIYFDDPRCCELIRTKNLTILGIDLAGPDIQIAAERIRRNGLADLVRVQAVDLFDLTLEGFNVIVFTESYPVIPQAIMIRMIQHICRTFKGQLNFINNIVERPALLQRTKPYLKHIFFGTDWGRLVNCADIDRVFKDGGITEPANVELLASATFNETMFGGHFRLPLCDFPLNQYLISTSVG